jgi:hypothetical protein
MAEFDTGEFSVYQFFPDDSYEKVREFVDHIEAVIAFAHYTHSVGARMGTTVRVIITDGGDFTNAEWKFGEGCTFPPEWVGKEIDQRVVDAMRKARDEGRV